MKKISRNLSCDICIRFNHKTKQGGYRKRDNTCSRCKYMTNPRRGTEHYEVCSKNTRTVWIARLELVSGESSWCRWVRTNQLTKTPFSGRRCLYLLISYRVLSKECFFRLSDCIMGQQIPVKFCVLVILLKKFSSLSERSSSSWQT